MELDRLTISRVIARLYALVEEKGISLVQCRDFQQLESLLRDHPDKRLTEHFRRSLNTYTPRQAFWLGGFNRNGQIVGLAAARLDPLGSWTLERYWREYWPRCYPDEHGSPVTMADRQFRFAQEISGDVAYLGEMWISKDHPHKDVAGGFSKALLLLALLEWDFTWAYAWVRPAFIDRGFAARCGFSSVYPGIRWANGPSTIDQDLRVMASSRADLIDLADLSASELL